MSYEIYYGMRYTGQDRDNNTLYWFVHSKKQIDTIFSRELLGNTVLFLT